MRDLNRVFITGRLTRDPDYRSTQTGSAVADFGIAVGDGDRTYFGAVVVWGHLADFVRRSAVKGTQVLICGRLTRDEWTSKDGGRQSKTRIVADSIQILRQPGSLPVQQPAADAAEHEELPYE